MHQSQTTSIVHHMELDLLLPEHNRRSNNALKHIYFLREF